MQNSNNKLLDFFRKKRLIIIFISTIVLINTSIYLITNKNGIPDIQARKDASGFSMDKAKHFSYFYYYTGNFPLATLNGKNLKYNKEAAYKEIETNGKDLIMEYKHWSRLGENARILAFLPNAYLKASPENPSIRLFNAIIFSISLIIIFLGFHKIGKTKTGILLALLINATPFFLYETYTNTNIFALLGSSFFIVLGLNLPILFSKKSNPFYIVITAIISSIILGFFSEIRNEISVVLVSLILIYVLLKNVNILSKIILLSLIIISFNSTKKIVRNYFNAKFEKTAKLVEKHKGHVYNGDRISGHKFWHPVFCGLGDFDKKYGYQWNDKVAYRYAVPFLNEKYGYDFTYINSNRTNKFYDEDKLYYIKYDEIEEYEEVVKDKVLSDIQKDPFWYITIIIKRIVRTLSTTIPIPYAGWLIFPLLVFLFKRKKWDYIKLLIISLPLSVTSILIYSGNGSTYNSVFVYIVLIIVIIVL